MTYQHYRYPGMWYVAGTTCRGCCCCIWDFQWTRQWRCISAHHMISLATETFWRCRRIYAARVCCDSCRLTSITPYTCVDIRIQRRQSLFPNLSIRHQLKLQDHSNHTRSANINVNYIAIMHSPHAVWPWSDGVSSLFTRPCVRPEHCWHDVLKSIWRIITKLTAFHAI